jgi:hypothetical protein|tara:strand:+ start:188 stop:529 length:342 start_codon:yes stop_codon:yes gene_type:complete
MKHLMIALGALFVFALGTQSAQANLKKDYCSNQEYYTNAGVNDGSKYPHLHCGKTFLTYSASSGKHYNFVVGDALKTGTAGSACSKADEQSADALKDIIAEVCTDDSKTCTGC